MTTLVRQQGEADCFASCLAMILDISYEAACLRMAELGINPQKAVPSCNVARILGYQGVAVRTVFVNDWNILGGVRLMISDGHYVVLDEKGVAYDPARGHRSVNDFVGPGLSAPFDVWEIHQARRAMEGR